MGKNKIINGKMEIAQRGTSFAAVVAGQYTLDRWRFSSNTTSAVITVSQQSDVPSSNEFQNSLRLAVTTADTTIASTDQVNIQQRIEGYNVRDLIGKTFALSFWVRSTKTGTHCAYFQNSAQDRTFVVEYTVSASNTWESKTVTVSGGLITAGTWDWTTGTGLLVGWTLAAGSTAQTTAGAWQTGTFFATSAQVNCLDSTSNIFAITGVQLEVGSVATPFEHRPYQTELALAQRYYEVGGNENIYSGYANSGSAYYDAVRYAVVKRATPSTIVFSDVANVGFPNSAPTLGSNNASGFYAQKTSNATSTAAYFQYSWTSNAEL